MTQLQRVVSSGRKYRIYTDLTPKSVKWEVQSTTGQVLKKGSTPRRDKDGPEAHKLGVYHAYKTYFRGHDKPMMYKTERFGRSAPVRTRGG